MTDRDKAFYEAWAAMLGWLRSYAAEKDGVVFVKQADFTDYIYRMERPYDLPTTIMAASLSDLRDNPVLLVTASPRQALFKEVVVHPFESHVYRKLKLSEDGSSLVEGKRPFDEPRLVALADELFALTVSA